MNHRAQVASAVTASSPAIAATTAATTSSGDLAAIDPTGIARVIPEDSGSRLERAAGAMALYAATTSAVAALRPSHGKVRAAGLGHFLDCVLEDLRAVDAASAHVTGFERPSILHVKAHAGFPGFGLALTEDADAKLERATAVLEELVTLLIEGGAHELLSAQVAAALDYVASDLSAALAGAHSVAFEVTGPTSLRAALTQAVAE